MLGKGSSNSSSRFGDGSVVTVIVAYVSNLDVFVRHSRHAVMIERKNERTNERNNTTLGHWEGGREGRLELWGIASTLRRERKERRRRAKGEEARASGGEREEDVLSVHKGSVSARRRNPNQRKTWNVGK